MNKQILGFSGVGFSLWSRTEENTKKAIRKMWRLGILFLVSLNLQLAVSTAAANESTFTTIDYPGATLTYAMGINAQGDIVGFYKDTGGKFHGFLMDLRGFVSIDYPLAARTDAWAINAAGDIVGTYNDSVGTQHGYLLQQGRFTTIDVPGATLTGAFGINSAGDIVGHYGVPPNGKMKGFLLRNGRFKTYDFPDPNKMICLMGINPEGQIVGHYQSLDGIVHGLLVDAGSYISLDIPDATNVQAYGINPMGEIVGFYTLGSTGKWHGFLMDKWAVVTQIDVPDAGGTWVRRNNPSGHIVGNYQDAAGNYHGFLMLR